jgi:acyl transferase domain-containing protein
MSKRKKRTTVITLASSYGLSIETVRSIARAEGIDDDQYNINGVMKERICAKLDDLQTSRNGQNTEKSNNIDARRYKDLEQQLRQRDEQIRLLNEKLEKKAARFQDYAMVCRQSNRWRQEAFDGHTYKQEASALREQVSILGQENRELKKQLIALKNRSDMPSHKLFPKESTVERGPHQYERENLELRRQLESAQGMIEKLGQNINASEKESLQKDAECAALSSLLNDSLREIYNLKVNIAGITTLQYWFHEQNQSMSTCNPPAVRNYLARLLHKRFEDASRVIFGSYENPEFQHVTYELADKLKSLGFGNDIHPDCYNDEDCDAYYCLRYEMMYAFEYFVIYYHLLKDIGRVSQPLEITSLGAGQGLDLWGLMYALTKLPDAKGLSIPIRWTGVDLEAWPTRIIDQAWGIYYIRDNIISYLDSLDGNMPQVLMFPKSICELDPNTIDHICEWIRNAKLSKQTHYVAIVHTDKSSLNKAHQGNRSEDSVKAGRVIEAFTSLGRRCGYVRRFHPGYDSVEPQHYPRNNHNGWFGDFEIGWSGFDITYNKIANTQSGDPAFASFGLQGSDSNIFNMVGLLYVRCKNNGHRTFNIDHLMRQRFSSCDNVWCGNTSMCPLHRYPRTKLENMAYQLVRIDRISPLVRVGQIQPQSL